MRHAPGIRAAVDPPELHAGLRFFTRITAGPRYGDGLPDSALPRVVSPPRRQCFAYGIDRGLQGREENTPSMRLLTCGSKDDMHPYSA